MSKRAILVLGMHRSGTSLLTKILTIMGATPPAGLLLTSVDNPIGYWEALSVNDLNEKLLYSTGNTWKTYKAIPDKWFKGPEREDDLKAALRIIEEEFGGADTIVLKCPRICRLIPFWVSAMKIAEYDVTTIKIIRDPEEVFLSLAARSILPQTREISITSPEHAAMLWLRYVLDAELHSRNLPGLVINYSDLLNNRSDTLNLIVNKHEFGLNQLTTKQKTDIDNLFTPEKRRKKNPLENTIQTGDKVFDQFKPLVSFLMGKPDAKSISTLNELTNQLNKIYTSCNSDNTARSNIEPDNSFHFEVHQKFCKSLVSLKQDRIPVKYIKQIMEYTHRVFAKS